MGGTIILFRGWCDTWGQVEALHIDLPRVDLFTTRRIAQTLLGRDSLTAYEWYGEDGRQVAYLVPIDLQHEAHAKAPVVAFPRAIRWYDGRGLSAGLGQTNDGFLTFNNKRFLQE